MLGEIICIGDELISGRVPEGNSRFITSRLWPLGFGISAIVMVGDDPEAITQALNLALGRAEFVIVSGGLGATDDDITARVAARVFGLPITESQRMVGNLRVCFEAMGMEVPGEALKMAQLPEGAEILDRFCAGFKLSGPGGKPVYFLPGVPQEMQRITRRKVLPQLLERFYAGQSVESLVLHVLGLGETEVSRRLQGLADPDNGLGIGYYPVFPEVHVLLSARAADQTAARGLLDELAGLARERLGAFVVAEDGLNLEEVVARDMTAQGLTLALAESCTGGLIGHILTLVPGSSAFLDRGMVVYSNQAKMDLLGVSPDTLAAHGAVSAETAAEMARGARERSGTDLGLAVTGIAGPDGGSDQKPVGTVYFGLADQSGVRTGLSNFIGGRAQIKAQAAAGAINWLRLYLEDHAFIRGA